MEKLILSPEDKLNKFETSAKIPWSTVYLHVNIHHHTMFGFFNKLLIFTYCINERVSLYIVKADFSVTASCSMALPVNKKKRTASKYSIHCFIVSVSMSAWCFSFLASFRYWFWSLEKFKINILWIKKYFWILNINQGLRWDKFKF